MPSPGSGGSVSHERYSSFFLFSSDKKLSLGLNCTLESTKSGYGEEKRKSVVLGCSGTLVTKPQETKSNAFFDSL